MTEQRRRLVAAYLGESAGATGGDPGAGALGSPARVAGAAAGPERVERSPRLRLVSPSSALDRRALRRLTRRCALPVAGTGFAVAVGVVVALYAS